MPNLLLIGGAIVLIIVVAALVVWFVRRSNAKYAELWPPLASQVNGTFKSSKMTGTYEGQPVQARVSSLSEENSTKYYFELTLTPGTHGKDWLLRYTGDKLLGMGQKSWHVKTRDEALKQRLIDGGVLALIEQWNGYPDVVYKANKGTLKYEQQIRNMHALPTVDQFKAQLDLLSRLSQINQQVNVV